MSEPDQSSKAKEKPSGGKDNRMGVKVAWIGLWSAVAVAVIGGLFVLLGRSGSGTPPAVSVKLSNTSGAGPAVQNSSPGGIQGTQAGAPGSIQAMGNQIFIVLGSDTTTIARLTTGLTEATNSARYATKQEIETLAESIKQLNAKTAGSEVLPDGRVLFGGFIIGPPRILVNEIALAWDYGESNQFDKAFEHGRLAINTYEAGKEAEEKLYETRWSRVEGILAAYEVARLYSGVSLFGVKAITNMPDKRYDTIYNYAMKAYAITNDPEFAFGASMVSYGDYLFGSRKGRPDTYEEAIRLATEAIRKDPNNQRYHDIRKIMTPLQRTSVMFGPPPSGTNAIASKP